MAPDRNEETSAIEWGGLGSRQLTCLVCGQPSGMRHIVTAPYADDARTSIPYFKCDNCSSLIADGALREYTDYSDEDYTWDHYLQLGAGIDFMVRPLEILGIQRGANLLDIGCGYGFTLDYWAFISGGEAVGLEPSGYGNRGQRELGVNIIPKYLIESEELRGRQFSRIISSEVIEHVPDPLQFLVQIRGFLAPGGIAVLTTPDAGYVQEGNPLSILMSVLSPGHHKLLLSQSTFEDLLKQSGFTHYRVNVVGERLVAYASMDPIDLGDRLEEARANYIRYLEHKVSNVPADSALGLGVRYRLFKEYVNDGRSPEAHKIGQTIQEHVSRNYHLDASDLDQCRSVIGYHDFKHYGTIAPYFLPNLLFYISMLARHGYPLGTFDPADGFSTAAELCADPQKITSHYFQEAASLYWVAVFEEGVARLVAGERELAATLFERVQTGPLDNEHHLLFCGRPHDLVRRATVQLAIATLQSDRAERSMVVLRAFFENEDSDRQDALTKEAIGIWTIAHTQARDSLPDWVSGAMESAGTESREGGEGSSGGSRRIKTLIERLLRN